MGLNELITSNYNSFLVGLVNEKEENTKRRVLRIFDSKALSLLRKNVARSQVSPTLKLCPKDINLPYLFEDQLYSEEEYLTMDAVALVGLPMHASIINIIKCFLQANGRCRKAVLLISPPNANNEALKFTVLCILSKGPDVNVFLKDLETKAIQIFKDENIYACGVNVYYQHSKDSLNSFEAGKQAILDDSESNPCPVCLERLIDSSNPPSLFTMLCMHTFHASCLLAWGGISCPLCRRSHITGYSEEMIINGEDRTESLTRHCQTCATSEDIFICLGCGYEGCGKSKMSHAMMHASEMNHQMGLQVSTNSVYNLETFQPIYNLTVKPVLHKSFMHAGSSSLESDNKEGHFEEIKLLRAQLVSQTQHFDALLQETDEEQQELLGKLMQLNVNLPLKEKAPVLRSKLAIQKASNQELSAQIKSLNDSRNYYLERGDELASQLAKDKSELEQLKFTAYNLERELAVKMKLLG